MLLHSSFIAIVCFAQLLFQHIFCHRLETLPASFSHSNALPVSFLDALYLLILANHSRSNVERVNLTFLLATLAGLVGPGPILLLFLFLGPIFPAFLTWMFIGSFSANSLIPSNKICTVWESYYFLAMFFFSKNLFSQFLLLRLNLLLSLRPLPKMFPNMGLAICPKIGAPNDASSSIVIVPTFYFLFSPQYTQPLFYILFSSCHSKQSSSL